MEKQVILLDTSILIDYFRKKDKTKSILFKLSTDYQSFAISTVTKYEIYFGAHPNQIEYWDGLFKTLIHLPFDDKASEIASNIQKSLKKHNSQIAIPDLFIAATAVSNNLACATLNKKHFEKISELMLVNS